MRGRTLIRYWWGLLLLMLALRAVAGESGSAAATVDSLFRYGEMHQAEQIALNRLSGTVPNDERVKLLSVLAQIRVVKNDVPGAIETFRDVLRLKPDFTLDPVNTSPKIYSVFEQASDKSRISLEAERISYELQVERKHWSGVPKGVILPGWGMLEQGRNSRGWVYLVGEAALVSSAVYFTLDVTTRDREYSNANSAQTALERWDELERTVRYRNYAWGAVGLLHAIGVADLVYQRKESRVTLTFAPSDRGVGLRIGW